MTTRVTESRPSEGEVRTKNLNYASTLIRTKKKYTDHELIEYRNTNKNATLEAV